MDKYGRIDVWWCAKCRIKWLHPSIPHDNRCPKCGVGGWWQRFASAEDQKNYRMVDVTPESESGL